MAHGDYGCCAVCDKKLRYGDYPSKYQICPECVGALAQHGVVVTSPATLLAWMKVNDPDMVLTILHAVNFKPCCYGNDIDDAYMELYENSKNPPALPANECARLHWKYYGLLGGKYSEGGASE